MTLKLQKPAASVYPADSDSANQCERYAEHCRVQLRTQKADNIPLKIRKGVTAEKPTFEPTFISVSGGQSAGRYRDFVYSPNDKILTMLGVDPKERENFPSAATERKAICDKVLGYLLKRCRYARNEFALGFKKKMVHQLSLKFEKLEELVDNECSCVTFKESSRESMTTVRNADPVDRRKMMLLKSSDTGPNMRNLQSGMSANRKLLLEKANRTRSAGNV